MAVYYYVAKTRDGKTIKNIQEVDSREELIADLRGKGLFVISVVEKFPSEKKGFFDSFLSGKKAGGKHGKITLGDMCFFARNMAIALAGGMPLLRSLELTARQSESAKLSAVVKQIQQDVRDGLSLSEAIKKYPRIFTNLWQGIIEVGEASGNLAFVLERLADYLEKNQEYQRKIKGAMTYPLMVCIGAGGSLTVFFKFILPKFANVFTQFGMELPQLTKVLFRVSKIVEDKFLLILASAFLLIIGFNYFRKTPHGKFILDRFFLIFPLSNKLVTMSLIERFCSTLYILLESGVPIVYSLEIIARSIGNSAVVGKINQIKENVKKGKNLSEELQKIDIFPPLLSEIAKVGEESGNMAQVFQKLASYYQAELSARMEQLMAMFEPLIIILLALGIGTVVIALFLPIFKMSAMGGG